ncbi:MAG: hypothetical protein MK073_00595 [Phycisphaerales bacterium]|nr:hypothetical protein [Phycisphaerales bacterium]
MILLPIILTLTCVQSPEQMSDELKASFLIGARVASHQRATPIVNQVVFVPNEATYLNEISKWSTEGQWPVLFDSEPRASQFIRKFKPKRILRAKAVEGSTESVAVQCRKAVASALGASDGDSSLRNALSKQGKQPLGAVITNEQDSARTAAVALAAAYGQPIKFIGKFGSGNTVLNAQETNSLIKRIDSALTETGYAYGELGDDIDAITMCMSLPSRCEFTSARENPIAISDVIGRHKDGTRFAWAGWIFGSKSDAAYMAMCSLFLDRTQYWFCNTYQNSGSWQMYGLGNIESMLPKVGLQGEVIDGTLRGLQEADIGGVTADVMFMNSKGNADFFDMKHLRSSPAWIPILDTPSALMMIHSWSLKNPAERLTVGGTWLSRGIYAYVGSSHEPMLNAFVPPTEMMRRLMSGFPFLVAARWHDGQNIFAKPWRVNTIGDPLMLCPPKDFILRKTVEPSPSDAYSDVMLEVKQVMERVKTEPSDVHFAQAMQLTTLIGADEITYGLWNAALEQNVVGALSAKRALPALFRLEHVEAFIWAYRIILNPNRLEKDMLWHLCSLKTATPIDILMKNVRTPFACDDITLIAPRVLNSHGSQGVLQLITEALKKANGRNKRELERMRKNYGG